MSVRRVAGPKGTRHPEREAFMNRVIFAIVVAAGFFALGANGRAARPPLEGTWTLDRMVFVEPDSGIRHYDDMLMFSSHHYMNVQLWQDGSGRVNAHTGTYRVSRDTLYRRTVFANRDELKSDAERASVIRVSGDTLYERTRREGAPYPRTLIWVYRRLDRATP
jgi:hypothetical protein